MTNTQLLLSIGIPSIMVLIGILLNLTSNNRVENRLGAIKGDLRRFFQLLGEHSAHIENLQKSK